MTDKETLSAYFSMIGKKGGQKSKGGGRPKTYKTEAERKAARKETQRKYRAKKQEEK